MVIDHSIGILSDHFQMGSWPVRELFISAVSYLLEEMSLNTSVLICSRPLSPRVFAWFPCVLSEPLQRSLKSR